jgi:transcriptional regulator with GAF, ATPase, and Fis domain
VVAATNRDLAERVREGEFREDLYYRLSVVPLRLPPLRERAGDVADLATHALGQASARLGRSGLRIPPAVMRALEAYDWPGNVRELLNVIERAAILSDGPDLSLPEPLGAHALRPATSSGGSGVGETLEAVERAHIERVLQSCGGRVRGEGGAAERLGINPSTLRSRMKKLGVERG